MSNYPAQIDTSQSLPTVIDGQTPVRGAIFNKLRDAVIAIESELGVKPSSIYSTVRNRLDVIENNMNIISAINLNGDVIGPFNNTQIVSLRGKPLSSVAPTLNQVLGWNGVSWSPITPTVSETVGGDLTGSLPNPLVTGLYGYPIDSTPPAAQEVLTWTGSAWKASAGSSVSAGNGLFTSGSSINVGENADQTILVNSADVQLNPNFYSINSVNGTLVERDLTFGFINVSDVDGTARYGAGILLTESSNFTLQQTQLSTNTSAHNMVISPQAPYGASTGANRLPGNLIINIPASAGALASVNSGNISLRFDNTERIRLTSDPAIPAGIVSFPGHGQISTVDSFQITSGTTSTYTSNGSMLLQSGSDVSLFATTTIGMTSAGLNAYSTSDITINSDAIIYMTGGLNISDPGGFGVYITANGGGSMVLTCSSGMDIVSNFVSFYPQFPSGSTVNILVPDNSTTAGDSLIISSGNASTAGGIGGNLTFNAGNGSSVSGNIGFGGDPNPLPNSGGGQGCIFIANRIAAPSSNPINGGILYVESGALKYKGSSGTITTIANA